MMAMTRIQTSNSTNLRLEYQQANEGFLNKEAHGEQLLPGIPNDVTFHKIVPKLLWRDFYVLLFVSSYWRDAIRSHHVHNARVQVNSRETLRLYVYGLRIGVHTVPALQLICITGNCVVKLPPIADLPRPGIPRNCRCLLLDGKIYVFGGDQAIEGSRCSSNRAYVLDVAGFKQWRECARMQHARQDFGCGVRDGKVYVFGGCDSRAKVDDPTTEVSREVYDPTLNTWSLVTCKMSLPRSLQDCPSVAIVGEENFPLRSQVDFYL